MFDWRELQMLISGASVPIDLEDLMDNTRYGGRKTFNGLSIYMTAKWCEKFLCVRKGNRVCKWFSVQVGLHQGYGMSPWQYLYGWCGKEG